MLRVEPLPLEKVFGRDPLSQNFRLEFSKISLSNGKVISTRSRSMPARAKFSKDSKGRICNRSSSVSEFKFVDEFALTNDI